MDNFYLIIFDMQIFNYYICEISFDYDLNNLCAVLYYNNF